MSKSRLFPQEAPPSLSGRYSNAKWERPNLKSIVGTEMDKRQLSAAAALIAEMRRGGDRIGALPADLSAQTISEAHQIQDLAIDLVGEKVAGWKVAGAEPGKAQRGAIFQSRLLSSPARISAKAMPLLGFEAEVAFRLDEAMPRRGAPYTREEVIANVSALVAIEIVDTRFASYEDAPKLDRLADMMSNGALVIGDINPDWRVLDLTSISVKLRRGSETIHEATGGHGDTDPLLPLITAVNVFRQGIGLTRGQILTAGSYSGLRFGSPGDTISATFEGLGEAAVHFDP